MDAFALEQVFRNILENSLQACSDPVKLTVCCSPIKQGGQSGLSVAIRDNGPGFTPAQQEQIFEPFFTDKTHGTGLGMAIAKRLVEAHGGSISARNAKSGGAEIVVYLPTQIEYTCHTAS